MEYVDLDWMQVMEDLEHRVIITIGELKDQSFAVPLEFQGELMEYIRLEMRS